MQYFATVSFGVQTNHIRQPLNNHTRPFYLPELMFNVRNTVSSLSGRHDTTEAGLGGGGGGLGKSLARIVLATQVTQQKIVPSKHQPKSQGMLVSR